MSITDKLKEKNCFLPDVRRIRRLKEWAYFKDRCLHLHELTDETLEKLMRNLGPFYHAVESVEADCYPTVEQFREELKKFYLKKLAIEKEKFPYSGSVGFQDRYFDEDLEELILFLEPLFHKDLNNPKLYYGIETPYIWIATNDQAEDNPGGSYKHGYEPRW